MRRIQISLVQEPRGSAYEKLLTFSIHDCTSALLVVRNSVTLSKNAKNVIKRLEPYLFSEEKSRKWPGTVLHDGDTALVMTYTLDHSLVTLLSEVAEGLYDWVQPNLPEDLCLLRRDGAPWLVTIAHERDGYFELTDEELHRLRHSVPQLQLS